MSYLFDASSIFEAIVRNKVEVLAGNYTVELARFELGNVLWKRRDCVNAEKYKSLASLVKRTLNLMEVLSIDCNEAEVAELADRLNITFYDASYVFLAKSKNLSLVTEDKKLKSRVKGHIEILSLNNLSFR